MQYHSLMPIVPEDHKETGEVGDIFATPEGVFFLTTTMLAVWDGSTVEVLTSCTSDQIRLERNDQLAATPRSTATDLKSEVANLKCVTLSVSEDSKNNGCGAKRRVRFFPDCSLRPGDTSLAPPALHTLRPLETAAGRADAPLPPENRSRARARSRSRENDAGRGLLSKIIQFPPRVIT
jgi:hypothetical protein